MELMTMGAGPVMSSLEFLDDVINPARAEAGESLHEPRKFLAKVEDELDLSDTGKKVRLNSNHTETAYYDLTIDQMMLVGMRESKAVRRSVLAKLKELDAQRSPQIPKTYGEALLEAGRLAMELDQAQAVIAIQAPKAEFADRVAGADKGTELGSFAKTVGLGPKRIFSLLRELRILMDGGNRRNLPFQDYLDRGYFSVAETTYDVHGETRLGFKPLITGKGQQWLTKKLIDTGHLKGVAA